jgi:hypothetical protein
MGERLFSDAGEITTEFDVQIAENWIQPELPCVQPTLDEALDRDQI